MLFLLVVGGNKRQVNVGGGIFLDRAVLLGVPGFSPLVVHRLWAPCSSVLLLHFASVVGGNRRSVNVGGGIVSARAVSLDVPGFSPLVVLRLWAPWSSVWLCFRDFSRL